MASTMARDSSTAPSRSSFEAELQEHLGLPELRRLVVGSQLERLLGRGERPLVVPVSPAIGREHQVDLGIVRPRLGALLDQLVRLGLVPLAAVQASEQIDQVEGLLLLGDALLEQGERLVLPVEAVVEAREVDVGLCPLLALRHLEGLLQDGLVVGCPLRPEPAQHAAHGEVVLEVRVELRQLRIERLGLLVLLPLASSLRNHAHGGLVFGRHGESLLVGLEGLVAPVQGVERLALDQVSAACCSGPPRPPSSPEEAPPPSPPRGWRAG